MRFKSPLNQKNTHRCFQVCKRLPLMIDKIERDIYNIIVLDKIITVKNSFEF